MNSAITTGEVVHGEFTSADASTAAAFTIYGKQATNGATARPTRPIVAGERLIVTDVYISSVTALTVNVFDDSNADGLVTAGEKIAAVALGALGVSSQRFDSGHYCNPGTTPKLKASGAGQVDAIIRGVIVKS